MKKALSLIVTVLLLTNCEDSNIVGPVFDDNADESYNIEKLADPSTSEIQLVLNGTAKFDPENGSGGYIGKTNIFYPSTMSMGKNNHKVNIIREVNSEPALYKGDSKRKVKGKFKIVERINNSVPNGSEAVLFIGKYQIQYNSRNTVDEIIYTGNGKNKYLGSRLTASETLLFEENLHIKRNKLRKGVSFPVFTSQLDGVVKLTLSNAD